MSTKSTIDKLWEQLRKAINRAYAEASDEIGENCKGDDLLCLRYYAEVSWTDSTAVLLGRECVNERQHRRGRPSVPGFSVESASKLLLLEQVASGTKLSEMPRATSFLVFQKTVAEAQVIGYIIREYLPAEFFEILKTLDYVELMKKGQVQS